MARAGGRDRRQLGFTRTYTTYSDPSTLDSSTHEALLRSLEDQEGEKQVHVSDEVLLSLIPLQVQKSRPREKHGRAPPGIHHHLTVPLLRLLLFQICQGNRPIHHHLLLSRHRPQTDRSPPSLPSLPLPPLHAHFHPACFSRTAASLTGHGYCCPSPATLSSFAEQQQSADLRTKYTFGERERSGIPPFDFQKFLDQMKLKGAEPVAKYLRSYVSAILFSYPDPDNSNPLTCARAHRFLSNFAKRTFTVNDQVKLISDFLNFISEPRSPASGAMVPPRPVTADDLERDRVLSQRISLFGWIDPKHLDVPEGEGSAGFLMFAQQVGSVALANSSSRLTRLCCAVVAILIVRVIFGPPSADLLAFETRLNSRVRLVTTFQVLWVLFIRRDDDHTSLSNLTQEEFEKNVEDAIQSLPSTGSQTPEPGSSPIPTPSISGTVTPTAITTSHAGEESAQPLALPTPSQTLGEDARRFLQKTGDTISKPLNAIGRIFSEVLDGAEESFPHLPGPFAPSELSREQQQQQRYEQGPYAVSQTPAGVSGTGQRSSTYDAMLQTPYKPRVRRVPSPQSPARSSASYQLPSPEETPSRYRSSSTGPYTNQALAIGPSQSATTLQQPRLQSLIQRERDLHGQSPHVSRTPTPNLDLAGLQDEIDRAHEKAAEASRETLRQIFPTTDVEVVEWVLEANEGDLGKSIEALLEMSSGT
ncbi:Vacuolar protein sorting-associated protein 9a [Grifola frondosa]|uniref:Vacuolar protein sorting-associated protein 9a n=1 Tax=Grifola frondosa TaxID=5627 RepID=A0A1C7MAV1_GRIFR|nr:Vacuolar protein sorting-associated protein 9a [Grifola frondosa]